jgi:hypothetical protein
MEVGDRVRIKNGATKWMKEHNYWLESMGHSIDGYSGEIINDYTILNGNDCHFEINIGFDFGIGVNPQWLELV